MAPAAAQQQLAAQAGVQARFNEFGTPRIVTAESGPIATGLARAPEAAAREYLVENRRLFGLSKKEVAALELVAFNPIGQASAVLLRQRFGDLSAGIDGLVSVTVRNGQALFASSSLTKDTSAPAPATLTETQGVVAAAQAAGENVSSAQRRSRGGADRWSWYSVPGMGAPAHAKEVAVPTPRDGVRAAYHVVLPDEGVASYVDARTGKVLVTEDLVDFATDNPTWKVFTNTPPMNYSSTDTRQIWCWAMLPNAPGCVRAVANAASPHPWDVLPTSPNAAKPTNRTEGNNARGTEKWDTNDTRKTGKNYTASPTRDYQYPWTNQWFVQGCNPTVFTSPQRNDIDAATANLFAMHNRMHDWTYRLGFTETAWNLQNENFDRGGRERDPEHGNAQAGGIVGGFPNFISRDNANQFTPADGVLPVTNMYLWQPIPGGFYAPCVDGDYDMSVIAHEYGHAVSNRMVAGPDNRLVGAQANAMGESWSDLQAVEYLAEYGFAPVAGENRWAVGPYVTGDQQSGIRNYGMNVSPLNYSDIGYDLTGVQVHADGEIWSAINFDIRTAFNNRYDAQFPSGDAGLQRRCADGMTPLAQCPGNRRWMQLVFDAWLLMADGAVSYVDARDAMLVADLARFGGANQDLLWNAFAARGLGTGASSVGVDDPDPVPSFESPTSPEGTVILAPQPEANQTPVAALYVGRYEARATPIADTDPATVRDERAELVPGTYDAIIRANGYGSRRVQLNVTAGGTANLSQALSPNVASRFRGASTSGDGGEQREQDALIDDTEATHMSALGAPVAGRHVTVRLAGDAPTVRRVQVSALLRPTRQGETPSVNRFSALRSFEILACRARAGVTCGSDADYSVIFTSPADAFPSVKPRPRAPELILRAFDVADTQATHLRLRVVDNQCTGAPAYEGEQDQDPQFGTDCTANSAESTRVRVAELQAFTD